MKNLVVGYGEIGKAVHEVLGAYHEVGFYDLNGTEYAVRNPQVLHLCYPYDKNFIDFANQYIAFYRPKLVIVWSTTYPGTCNEIGEEVVHSPVEGKHPRLADSIMLGVRWLGSKNIDSLIMAGKLFKDIGIKVHPVENSLYTEVLKIMGTTKYLWNIRWAEVEKSICKKAKMPHRMVNLWDSDYNELYDRLGMKGFKRYILTPPTSDTIGGHCLIPNFRMLKHYIRKKEFKLMEKYVQAKRKN